MEQKQQISQIIFSEEQETIFNYAQKGILNMIIQAVAGAGKTTTLVECANRMPSDKTVMMLAHNKSTRDTLRERIGDKPNVKIYTLHGLGWRLFTEHFGTTPEICEDKYRNYINTNMEIIGSETYKALSGPHKMIYKANIFDLINKARYNLKQSEREIKKMAEKKYGTRLVADECHAVANILKWGTTVTDVVDYQDLLWFPYEFGYYTMKYLADIIMLDEAQDASLAQQMIISRCFKRNTRLFAFGDSSQTINGWCGSDLDAFEHLKDPDLFRRDAEEFPLTTNYRCGSKIIEYAKKYTDNNIHPRKNAPEGIVKHEAHLSEAINGDMILCRNTTPLMAVYRFGIYNGQKMYFRGEELGKNLMMAVDCAEGDTIDKIIESMKTRLIATWDFLSKELNIQPKESMTDPRIISLLDTIKTMENLPQTVITREDFNKFRKEVFSDEGRDGIQLSTIHKAKGLEADNVYIICPSLIPSKLARLDWEKEEEKHLQYVMCTRPKNSLNFITEKEVAPPSVFTESKSLFSELTKIKNEIKA